MSSFTAPLNLNYDPKINMWYTGREFTYFVGEEGSENKITVPEGFRTDLASVPIPARWLIPKSGRYNQAAVLHDYLYTIQDRPRKEVDRIFLEAMGVLGVPKWKRWVMYRAVRIGGGRPWRMWAKKLAQDRSINQA